MPDMPNGTSHYDFYSDKAALDKALGKAVNGALRMHKLLGYPIVVAQDGKAVWIQPEDIQLLSEENDQASSA
jgi:hypothetical protein